MSLLVCWFGRLIIWMAFITQNRSNIEYDKNEKRTFEKIIFNNPQLDIKRVFVNAKQNNEGENAHKICAHKEFLWLVRMIEKKRKNKYSHTTIYRIN